MAISSIPRPISIGRGELAKQRAVAEGRDDSNKLCRR